MSAVPLPDALAVLDAESLARRLFSADTDAFWADGGEDGGAYAPDEHLLAAWPDRVERIRVDALPFRGLTSWLRERLPVAAPGGPRAPLTVVALAYDAGRNLERIPATAREDPVLPDVVVARYPAFLSGHGSRGPWTIHGDDAARARLVASLGREAPAWPPAPTLTFNSSMSRSEHRAALERILEGVRAGDLYQANVARRLEARFDVAATPALYAAMRRSNPAAYGALWGLGEGRWLASSSPECLLTFDPETRAAHSYPIKGTRRRGRDAAEDAALAAELAADVKERAEHVMIVDLVRNDLGRVAEIGSVRVARLFDVMTLPTVHHLVSDVAATLRSDRDLADLVGALFPGGSITGAPKIAAMQAIEGVEALRRGLYTGSLGVVTGDGAARFNILIRTCFAAEGRLFYQTGGGIVADSDPDREWEETEAKALALTRELDRSRLSPTDGAAGATRRPL